MDLPDEFPSSDFDHWAQTYDHDTETRSSFPFESYARTLETVVRLAAPAAGMSVLDIGTGTGNLAVRFTGRGCKLWCTDFSQAMLNKAREKLPEASFVQHDLRGPWPVELDRHFDRIVSAYVFHHFELSQKVQLCQELVNRRLAPDGKLVIADISFADGQAMKDYAASVGELWEQELYWVADESIAALADAGLSVEHVQVSSSAGVYCVVSHERLRAKN